MNHEQKMRILYALTCASTTGEADDLGICGGVHSSLPLHDWRDFDHWMCSQLRKWPHWSGSTLYPVSDPASWHTGSYQYDEARRTGKMWDENTEYGRRRWDLLRHLVMQMLKEV